jgi:hypothetical protein
MSLRLSWRVRMLWLCLRRSNLVLRDRDYFSPCRVWKLETHGQGATLVPDPSSYEFWKSMLNHAQLLVYG